MSNSNALICGVSGQDGSYLAKFLLEQGYNVFGSSRDISKASFSNLEKLGIKDDVHLLSLSTEDFRGVLAAIHKVGPSEIYNLSGQSSVSLSFEFPAETIGSINHGALNILEACRMLDMPTRIFHSGSGECFGDTGGFPSDELTPLMPLSPYALAQASTYSLVKNYRSIYGLFACTGLLFNHESPFRSNQFVTQKIIKTAQRISCGSGEKLQLGNLDISRDWGWAPEFVKAMWLMLQHDVADDYVVSTGVSLKLLDFISIVFDFLDLNWHDHVVQDVRFMRSTDIPISVGNPLKAKNILDWKADVYGEKLVLKMMNDVC